MKGFYKALKICTFCAPLPNSNRCWASFQTDQWHGYQCLFICISSWTQMMSDWSGRDFFDNIFLVWVLFILGADGGETLEKINSPKPLLESINFNALGNIFDSQHKTSRRNKKFLHSQNNFILRNTFFMSWCTMLTPLVIRSLSALSNYFIFFSHNQILFQQHLSNWMEVHLNKGNKRNFRKPKFKGISYTKKLNILIINELRKDITNY